MVRSADLHRLARQVREIALLATGNIGADAVTGGELAVIEDLARHPRSTVGEITERVDLAQSLVSRICQRMTSEGVMQVQSDAIDARKRRLTLQPDVLERARNLGDKPIDAALAAAAPALTEAQRVMLNTHLEAAAELLRQGRTPTAPPAP